MKDFEKFFSAKEDVLNNLSRIQMVLVECEERGLSDIGSEKYNELENLLSYAKTVNEAILKGVEKLGKDPEKVTILVLPDGPLVLPRIKK